MISKIKKTLAATFAISFLAIGLMPASVGAAEIKRATCQGAKLTFSSGTGDPTDPADNACDFTEVGAGGAEGKVNNLITDIINIFSVIVGIVAVIMIIYGGFRYITSGGDSSKVTDAKNTILYAVIGLIIVVFAQFVVKFILAKIAGNDSS